MSEVEQTRPKMGHPVSSKVVAASESPAGHRLFTIEECFWRPVLAERNTHRIQAKNSASSRARPVHKVLADLHEQIAVPVSWPREQKGMQGGEEITGPELERIQEIWMEQAERTLRAAEMLVEMGLHKSVVNRLLEPYSMHTTVTTATGWENYLAQRAHEDAQADIRVVAEMTQDAIRHVERTNGFEFLEIGDWHLPYVSAPEIANFSLDMTDLIEVSVARVARTSYLTQNGVRDPQEDLSLYSRLVTERVNARKPVHWSPLEQVATPDPDNVQSEPYEFTARNGRQVSVSTRHLPRVGAMLGWRTYRTEVEGLLGEVTNR